MSSQSRGCTRSDQTKEHARANPEAERGWLRLGGCAQLMSTSSPSAIGLQAWTVSRCAASFHL